MSATVCLGSDNCVIVVQVIEMIRNHHFILWFLLFFFFPNAGIQSC